MDYKRFDNKIVLRLKKGDKIIDSLNNLAKKEAIKAAHFQGIGAVDELKLGILLPSSDDYKWKTYTEAFEITSLMGNITILDDNPIVHSHIACAREGFEIIGGHLGEAICSFTVEIIIDLIDGKLTKKPDDDLGIDIIEFEWGLYAN